MQPIMNALHARGALVGVHVDDWIIRGESYIECLEHTRYLVHILWLLGILINVPNSMLEPSQELIILGLMLNFREGCMTVPSRRLQDIFQDLNRLADSAAPTVRRCASVLVLFVMPRIRLLSNSLAVHVAMAAQAGWEAVAKMPTRVHVKLKELADDMYAWKGRTFAEPMTQTPEVYSDASDLAWGGVLQGDSQAAFGWFLNREEHANVKEFHGAMMTIPAYV